MIKNGIRLENSFSIHSREWHHLHRIQSLTLCKLIKTPQSSVEIFLFLDEINENMQNTGVKFSHRFSIK